MTTSPTTPKVDAPTGLDEASTDAPGEATAVVDVEPTPVPTCKCGFDRTHYRVSREGKYSWMGWFLLSWGVSVEPLSVSWKCRLCNETFEHSTDPAELRKRS